MGGVDFHNITKARGRTVAQAFRDEWEQAAYESGHGGYTGTIAEKRSLGYEERGSFDTLAEAADFVNGPKKDNGWRDWELGDLDKNDKWGPAFVVQYRNDEGALLYWFYGIASS